MIACDIGPDLDLSPGSMREGNQRKIAGVEGRDTSTNGGNVTIEGCLHGGDTLATSKGVRMTRMPLLRAKGVCVTHMPLPRG